MRAIRMTAFAASLLLASGCVVVTGGGGGGGSTTGDLTVYWGHFGTSANCTAAGINTIRATLDDANGTQIDDQTYTCAAAGVTWNQLAPGTYTVTLNGIDANGLVPYAATASVDVVAGQANDNTVDLGDNTGSLAVQWTFAGSTACGSVTQVQLTIQDASGNTLDNNTYPCTDGGEVYDTAPAGDYTASAQGLDANGQILYQGTNPNVQVVAGTNQTFNVDMN